METGDAAVQYYHNAEMSKLTDSEGEYWQADDEWKPPTSSAKNGKSTAPVSTNMDRLNSFLDNDFDDDGSGFYFSDEEDNNVIKKKNMKVQRDLAEG